MARDGVQPYAEQWLAVLGGRFLPVTTMELSYESETTPFYSSSSLSPAKTSTTKQMITGYIRTRRNPYVPSQVGLCQLRLYGPDEVIHIWNMSLAIDRVPGDPRPIYDIEFEAIDWNKEKR